MNYTSRTSYRAMAHSGGTRANSGTQQKPTRGYVYTGETAAEGVPWSAEEINARIDDLLNYKDRTQTQFRWLASRARARKISAVGMSVFQLASAIVQHDNMKRNARYATCSA